MTALVITMAIYTNASGRRIWITKVRIRIFTKKNITAGKTDIWMGDKYLTDNLTIPDR